jgi:hypothetical protein
MYKNCALVFALISMFAEHLWAQEVKLDVLLSSSKIRIGEPLTLTITASYNASQYKLQWPTTQTNDVDPVAVLHSSVFPVRKNQQNYIQQCCLSVTAYDSGIFSLPNWHIKLLNDSTKRFSIPQVTFLAQTVPTDTSITKLKPLKPLIEIPFDWMWYTNYIIFGGIAVVLLILTIWYILKRYKKLNTSKTHVQVPPDVKALEDLNALLIQEVWKSGDVKLYYSQLTEILKEYIENRYQCKVMELTSAELLEYIRAYITDPQILNALERILTHSDFAKFAKQFHHEALHRELWHLSKSFVEQTRMYLNTQP